MTQSSSNPSSDESRLDRLERLMEQQLNQNAAFRQDINELKALQQRNTERQAEQNAAFFEGLNEVKALQQQNQVAISQLTQAAEQTRQAVVELSRVVSNDRSDLAEHTNDPNAHSE